MRIHTDAHLSTILEAARQARVYLVKCDEHGSRSRSRAFEIKLEGDSRRRPNGGQSGAGSGYAATWDQWGVFLAFIFAADDTASCWAYAGAADFHYKTNGRFEDRSDEVDYATEPVYWPADAHGDHRFEFSGTPGSQTCKNCSAVQRWM